MPDVFTLISPARAWLPAFALVVAVNLFVALFRRPLGRVRWILALLVACAPALTPHPGDYSPRLFGILDTVLTTFTIVSAARLPDLDRALTIARRTSAEIFLWMCLPTARFIPASRSARAANRKRAPRFLFAALIKRLAWEPLAYLIHHQDGTQVPWALSSAVLMLYFVLNLTAVADLACAFCLALGADIDELFDAPLLARSPRDFWSRRWNKFINRFALKHVALPLARKVSPSVIIFIVFVTSGAFHEYFAWGVGKTYANYGAMSAFFLLQGVAVWVGERYPLHKLPHAVGTILTFGWMTLTSPLFFWGVAPALQSFEYPTSWLPY